MQNYAVVYRAASHWGLTFVKTAGEAIAAAEDRAPGGHAAVTDVWACNIKAPLAAPFSLRGDGSFGRDIVSYMILDLKAHMKPSDVAKKYEKAGSLPGGKITQQVKSNVVPIVNEKKQPKKKNSPKPKPKPKVYRPPYVVFVAPRSTGEANHV